MRWIDKATLEEFRAEADRRTLYLLDVRPADEFEAGHLPGSVSAPSWDVAPWVFRRAATHNARFVLVDNDQVRATVAASWIIQIGWGEVYVLADALADEQLETGPVAWPVLGLPETGKRLVGVDAAQRVLAGDAGAVVDLQPSPDYRKAHVPTAVFANRAGLAGSAADIPGEGPILLVSEDGVLARLAAAELPQATHRPVKVLDGGFAAWQRAGLPVESGTSTCCTRSTTWSPPAGGRPTGTPQSGVPPLSGLGRWPCRRARRRRHGAVQKFRKVATFEVTAVETAAAPQAVGAPAGGWPSVELEDLSPTVAQRAW